MNRGATKKKRYKREVKDLGGDAEHRKGLVWRRFFWGVRKGRGGIIREVSPI